MANTSSLPVLPNFYITTHDSSGKSIFTQTETKILNPRVAVLYGSKVSPVNLKEAADLKDHEISPIVTEPKDGFETLVFNCPPGGKDAPVSLIHRNLAVDVCVMLSGSVEAVLDGGEVQVFNAGDVLIQRGTMHGWRNRSETEEARMIIVVLPSQEPTINGGEPVPGVPLSQQKK